MVVDIQGISTFFLVQFTSCSIFPSVLEECIHTANSVGHKISSFYFLSVQGVGDLYTDPQIHCTNLKEYGEANLGTKGMALFFNSHRCNKYVCIRLTAVAYNSARIQNQKRASSSKSAITKPISGCVCIVRPGLMIGSLRFDRNEILPSRRCVNT